MCLHRAAAPRCHCECHWQRMCSTNSGSNPILLFTTGSKYSQAQAWTGAGGQAGQPHWTALRDDSPLPGLRAASSVNVMKMMMRGSVSHMGRPAEQQHQCGVSPLAPLPVLGTKMHSSCSGTWTCCSVHYTGTLSPRTSCPCTLASEGTCCPSWPKLPTCVDLQVCQRGLASHRLP